jgi:hypothetical protein
MSLPPATYNELQRTDVAMDDFEGFLKDGNGGEESKSLAREASVTVGGGVPSIVLHWRGANFLTT